MMVVEESKKDLIIEGVDVDMDVDMDVDVEGEAGVDIT